MNKKIATVIGWIDDAHESCPAENIDLRSFAIGALTGLSATKYINEDEAYSIFEFFTKNGVNN